MKRHMKIIGMECVKTDDDPDKSVVKVILLPHEEPVKLKKPSLMDMVGGNMDMLFKQAMDLQQHKTEIYISMSEWLNEFGNQPFKDVWLELKLDVLITNKFKRR